MYKSIPAGLITNRSFYAEHFMDLSIWTPFVRNVCSKHGFICRRIISCTPGTYPTFIVDITGSETDRRHRSVVVKFFGPMFDGATSFVLESAMGQFLAEHPLPIRSPAILGEGHLESVWDYLIFEGIEGMSIRQVKQHLPTEILLNVAQNIGQFMKVLHTVTAIDLPEILNSQKTKTWNWFIGFLKQQHANCRANHMNWSDIPGHLIEQVTDYLLPVKELVDGSVVPHLIHADLTGDHLLGIFGQKRQNALAGSPSNWAVIDWGDTRQGNILYELVALHLDLFDADLHLLRACLEVYDLPNFYKHDFARKAMCMTLLHQFPLPQQITSQHREDQTFDNLAKNLFCI